MAGTIAEFFGYRAEDKSPAALKAAADKKCPFLGTQCTKILARSGTISGVCAIRQKTAGSPSVICCPNRIYADEYKMLRTIAKKAFGAEFPLCAGRTAVDKARKDGAAIAVFGHGWGGELKLPRRNGSGAYFVDWVLALLDETGCLKEFTAIEVQTIDTTGSYGNAQAALKKDRSVIVDNVGLNWANVCKRIVPQLVFKGQVLQREQHCRTGLYFVCPQPITDYVISQMGGKANLPSFPVQPASIHFVSYDYAKPFKDVPKGTVVPLDLVEEHCTTVYKLQEASTNINLPEGNVYGNAIRKCLYGK